jgi:hypothetical protein
MVSIESNPLDFGSLTIKSTLIVLKGFNDPVGLIRFSGG